MAEGRYSRIKSRFWNDEKVVEWDDDTKLLALYLMSSPHHNILGCYYLPMGYIYEDLNWETKRLGKPFAKLLAEGFIKYDKTTKVILVTNYLKNNPIPNFRIKDIKLQIVGNFTDKRADYSPKNKPGFPD